MDLSRDSFRGRVQPTLTAPTMRGNMDTAGAHSGGQPVELCSNVPNDQLTGRRIGVFNCWYELASTMFSLRIVFDVNNIATTMNLRARLASRGISPSFTTR